MRNTMRGASGVWVVMLVAGLFIGALTGYVVSTRDLKVPFLSKQDTHTSVATVSSGAGQQQVSESIGDSRDNAIVQATRLVAPSVVGIIVTQIQVVQSPYYVDDFFDHFFGPQYMPSVRQVENMGSGFIIRPDGLILTNYHVIEGARKLFVNFSDGRQMEGKVVGIDEATDIAVVSVPAKGLSPVKKGDSGTLMIGEWAIAIGNPFLSFFNDAHPTVTVGVVSALDRNFAPSAGVYYQGMIQTDAAINPGNSGGPLIDAMGQVIGINTFIFTGSGENRGSIGIGFAIPINRAARVADEIITYGRRRQVWTGISAHDLTAEVAFALGYDKTRGVVITDIQKDSPGDKAGLRRNDILLHLLDRVIQSTTDIEGFFLDYFVDDKIPVRIKRGSQEISATLVLKEYPYAR